MKKHRYIAIVTVDTDEKLTKENIVDGTLNDNLFMGASKVKLKEVKKR